MPTTDPSPGSSRPAPTRAGSRPAATRAGWPPRSCSAAGPRRRRSMVKAVVLLAVTAAVAAGAAPKPRIVWRPIPFPAARLAETAEYSRRHYGPADWRLRNPHVIVEHYTANTSLTSTWRTFASDAPDAE